ncbi:lytic murein transglycosylase [Thermoactinospora rubra]|uniref:lytic transglycosylase domain-containing protein n=1 Tax=Thermoactinospora rubra TaxID=1088767 RepID=UPI000A102AB1|nr:lytic murein transglycosylase [Thermoactinospora rubra]
MRLAHALTAGALAVALAGCDAANGSAAQSGSESAGRSALSAPPSVTATPSPRPPAPDAPIPARPAELARTLKATTAALYAAIDRWTESSQEQAPEDVILYGLHHQRIYRAMARDAELADATIRRLPKALAAEARDNVTAVSKLLSMARPISAERRKRMRLADPLPAERLRGYMERAEKRFGVEWEVLAAIMLVETKFGRVRSASSTGAQGPMQFMPGTWRAYGMGGNVHDARDAILAAANYLKATGAPKDYRRAVFAYNHDTRYVDAVLAHARQIKRDERSFYAYYTWQVFVLSTKGDVRLTGPGLA